MKHWDQDADLIQRLRNGLIPAAPGAEGLDVLLDEMGDARFVLLGESCRGIEEFASARGELTRRLIEDKGFTHVAWDTDATDVLGVERFLHGLGSEHSAEQSLRNFRRFPGWIWQNEPTAEFVRWLRNYNALSSDEVALVGLDPFDFHASVELLDRILEELDPSLAAECRERFSRFDSFSGPPYDEERATPFGYLEACERYAVARLVDEHEARARARGESSSRLDPGHFELLFRGGTPLWNHRVFGLARTLELLIEEAPEHRPAKIVVWGSSAQMGDARATSWESEGRTSLGQVLRERFPSSTFTVGFTSNGGTLSTCTRWGEAPRKRQLRPALSGSVEDLLHATGVPKFLLLSRLLGDLPARFQRSVGAVYRPDTESTSHYQHTKLAAQFDAVLHFDHCHAVSPLEGALDERVASRAPRLRTSGRFELPRLATFPL